MNGATEFTETAVTAGNEYVMAVPEGTEYLDIRVECTNILGQTAVSDIALLAMNEGALENVEMDSDDDMIPNGYEILYSHTDCLASDSEMDSDDDGLTAYEEYTAGTSPLYADTDFDGIVDRTDTDPLTTQVHADQSKYQTRTFEPELGIYDSKKVYLDTEGNRQIQIFNRITKDEYYDNNAGREFLRMTAQDNSVESVIFAEEGQADIETTEYDEEGRKVTWAVNGDIYQYEHDDAENRTDTYLNGNIHNSITYNENAKPVRMEYTNFDVVEYGYDEEGRILNVAVNGTVSHEYQYEGKY